VSETPDNLAVAFANTVYAVRGRPGDAIETDEELRAWLADHGLHAGGDGRDLRPLRDAVRQLFGAAVERAAPPPAALAAVNEASAAAPTAAVLRWHGDERTVVERCGADPATAMRARLAAAAIALLGGPRGPALRACEGPRCVQYLLQDHPRRAFCCDGCSTRARAARYYARHRGRRA
jgi:predicted RNA-binding Zn ribbon-like protein